MGDLVKCVYGFPDLYYGMVFSEGFLPEPQTYGIVVSLYWDQIIFQDEWVYEIRCLDGEYRYFLQSEMEIAISIP